MYGLYIALTHGAAVTKGTPIPDSFFMWAKVGLCGGTCFTGTKPGAFDIPKPVDLCFTRLHSLTEATKR
jgi:hypothetical protein